MHAANDDDELKLQATLDGLEETELLYGTALDGLEVTMERAAAELEGLNLDSVMAKADDAVAGAATSVVDQDVNDLEVIHAQLQEDDLEEDRLRAEDENVPLVEE